jgi:hypothetical protein
MVSCCLALVCLPLLVGCQPTATTLTAGSITEQKAYEIGYAALAKKLGYAPPSRDRWQWWTIRRDMVEGRDVWRVGADFAPAGGGDHGSAIIDATTGEVISVQTGRHLR